MPINWSGVDFEDPCAVLAKLRPAYFQLIAEGGVAEVQFSERRLRFEKPDLPALERVMARLEADCKRASGQRSRFAIRAGTRR